MYYDKIINRERFILHHKQADIALHTLGFATGNETVDLSNLHGNPKAHCSFIQFNKENSGTYISVVAQLST
jgi:hypothetical protein